MDKLSKKFISIINEAITNNSVDKPYSSVIKIYSSVDSDEDKIKTNHSFDKFTNYARIFYCITFQDEKSTEHTSERFGKYRRWFTSGEGSYVFEKKEHPELAKKINELYEYVFTQDE